MNYKSNKIPFILLAVFVFIITYIFFTNIHPLVIYDADDWTYVALARQFIPILHAWNPAKLFPETLMPLCGSIASFIIYPITQDYIGSFTIVTAFVVAFFISIYIYTFSRLLYKKSSLNITTTIALTVLFFLFHFLLFASNDVDNQYLFLSHNVNCYYNYLIPNLLNFIIVFTLLTKDDVDYSLSLKNPFKKGLYFLILYTAIFSNLYCNIILVVFAGSILIINFCKEIKHKFNIKNFIKKYFVLLAIISAWFISLIFELSGGRAQYPYNGNYLSALIEAITNIKTVMTTFNRSVIMLLIGIVIIFIISLIINIKKKNENENLKKVFAILILSIFFIFAYFILISAKVNPSYVTGAEYIYGLWAYFLVLVFMCFGYLINKYPQVAVILPFLVVFFFIDYNCSLRTFKESNTSNIDPIICKKIDEDLVFQIKEAEKKRLSKVYLHVPQSRTDDNWPHTTYFGDRISNTLYKHGITKKKLNIEIVPDSQYNEKFGL